jgi:type VI secretion system secreted protein Hcp
MAMPIYMQYEGINGSVTAAGHEKWIELTSLSMNVIRNVTSPSGRGTNREAAVPSVSEILVTGKPDR